MRQGQAPWNPSVLPVLPCQLDRPGWPARLASGWVEAMAIFHLHVRNISRGDGRSAVAAAAYRAGETLANEAEERDSAFGGRRDVLHAEIRLPAGAPDWMGDRTRLWNAVEAAERRKDARLAKEIEFALPRDLPRPHWLTLARAMADAYTRQGYVVDLAIHDDGRAHNPHAHLMLTTRVITPKGFGAKIRDADGFKFVTGARALWAKIANVVLAGAGSDARIDARSHREAGIEAEPGKHRRPDREERRRRRSTLDEDLLEAARRDLLKLNPRIEHPFPNLAQRPDWPPSSRDMPAGMTRIEEAEFKLFWDAVDARAEMITAFDRKPDEDRFPVPDPDGNPIAPSERRQAEDRMLAEVEGTARNYPRPPHPDVLSTSGQAVARTSWEERLEKTGEYRETSAQEQVREDPAERWWEKQGAGSPDGGSPGAAPEDDRDPWWRTR